MSRRAILVGLCLLGGCNLAPKHVRPDLPTAPLYPAEAAGDVTLGQRATDIGWRDFFADPRLEALVSAALARNRDLVIAVARIEEARGLYRIENANRIPTIDLDASATRSRVGNVEFDNDPDNPATDDPTTRNRYSVSAGVSSFELDFWGRVRNLSEAARAEYLATAQAERAFRLSLIRDVAAAYLASREADERIALAEATVTSRREGLRIARRRLDAGVTSALDFRQSETLLSQAETALSALRRERAESDNLLAVLVGGPVAGPLPPPLPLSRQLSSARIAAGLPSELLVARPDIIAAEERLRGARANVGAARAEFFPTISLTGSLGFATSSLSNLVGADGLNWSFGPAINLPVNFARAGGNLTAARARENIAIATYERTIQTAFQEVANALAGRRYLSEQVEAQEQGTQAQRALVSLARARYREGVVNYLEVLDAERNLFDAEQALLQLRRAQVENLVSLYVALGGGRFEGAGTLRP